MRKNYRQSRGFTRIAGFRQRVENTVVFVADMRGINAAVPRGHPRQCDYFTVGSDSRGRVEQAGTHPERPRPHPFFQQLTHPRDVAGARGTVHIVEYIDS